MNDKKIFSHETLLDISNRQYRTAKFLYQIYPSDDGVINDVAYHLQQCVELCIKHILESYNIKYPKSHNIRDLLQYMPQKVMPIFKDILIMSDDITALEADTRYLKGYRANLNIVQKVFIVSQDMLKQANSLQHLFRVQNEQNCREDAIWKNKFSPGSPEYVFCQNYNKCYRKLGAPTLKESYDKATIFATKALYFAGVSKDRILSVIDNLAPMVPHQNEDKPYMLEIIHTVEEMEDIKIFKNKHDIEKINK